MATVTSSGKWLITAWIAAAVWLGAAAPASAYLRDFQAVSSSTAAESASVKATSVNCPAGKLAIGTGGSVVPSFGNLGLDNLWVYYGQNRAYDGAAETGPLASAWRATGQAFCATSVGIVPLGGGGPFIKQRFITRANGVSNSLFSKSLRAFCPGGSTVIGGGGAINTASRDVALTQMGRISDGAWQVSAHEVDFTSTPWSLTAYAICANTTTVPPGAFFVGGAGIFAPDTGPGALRFGTGLPVFAHCPANGSKIIGGGAFLTGATPGSLPPPSVVLTASNPFGDTAWAAFARDTQPPFEGYHLQVRAVCG
jgi:hypothetical protein